MTEFVQAPPHDIAGPFRHGAELSIARRKLYHRAGSVHESEYGGGDALWAAP